MVSCQTDIAENQTHPLERLPDNRAGEIVKKAIEYAGGWEAWEAKQDFAFYKIITQLDTAGAVKKKVTQFHEYNMKPHFQAKMTWSMDGADYQIINDGQEAKKYENGIELTDDKSKNEAWNSSYGSNYVIQMPFKLTDPGVILTDDGIDSTTFDTPVLALKVDYKKGAGSTGGMHKWWYYFDIHTYDMVANYLDYGTGYSLTTYETYEDVSGFRIHKKRYSYASNEHKEMLYIKTIYENADMKFDTGYTTEAFTLK